MPAVDAMRPRHEHATWRQESFVQRTCSSMASTLYARRESVRERAHPSSSSLKLSPGRLSNQHLSHLHVGERERQHDFCPTRLVSIASQLFRREQLLSAAVARPPAELDFQRATAGNSNIANSQTVVLGVCINFIADYQI